MLLCSLVGGCWCFQRKPVWPPAVPVHGYQTVVVAMCIFTTVRISYLISVKVKLSLCMLWRHGGRGIALFIFYHGIRLKWVSYRAGLDVFGEERSLLSLHSHHAEWAADLQSSSNIITFVDDRYTFWTIKVVTGASNCMQRWWTVKPVKCNKHNLKLGIFYILL